jgi:hypothetical protein
MTEPIRVFVGSDRNGGCAENQMVFEYSLRKHATRPIELTWMQISDDPASFWYGWETRRWSTPFSGFRYGIAEFCKNQGKAIYCDDDQLWLADPALLWDTPITGKNIMTGKSLGGPGDVRHCVSVIDCQKFGAVVPPASRRKTLPQFCEMMKEITFPLTEIIDDNWNNYDGENAKIEDIKLLHFTDMRTNPGIHLAIKRLGSNASHWYNGAILKHRRQDVVDTFMSYYNGALEAGYKVENYIPAKRVEYKMLDQTNYVARNGFDVSLGE